MKAANMNNEQYKPYKTFHNATQSVGMEPFGAKKMFYHSTLGIQSACF